MNGKQAKAIRKEARAAVTAARVRRGKGEILGKALDDKAAADGASLHYSVRRHPLRRKRTVVVVYRTKAAE